jgi:hypothetical protein
MNKFTSFILISLSALLLFTGCSTDAEDTAGTDYLLAGYYMIAGEAVALPDDAAGASRASVPVHQTEWSTRTFQQWIDASPTKINNYPERGQKTYVTVSESGTANIYFVSSRTEYPKKEDLFDYYLEEYFVEDTNVADDAADGNWTVADVTVKDDKTTRDSKARIIMEVHFQDGSIRKEWIYDDSTGAASQSDYYAHFDIDGDLTIPTDTSWVPPAATTGDGMEWSSKVYYYQKIESYISWFYKENKETFGVRYYTFSDDVADDNKYHSSTLTFENTLTRKVSSWGDSDWGGILDWVFGGSSSSTSGSSSGDTLAETVVREQITENNKKTVNSQTRVVPSFGDEFTIDKSIEYDLID